MNAVLSWLMRSEMINVDSVCWDKRLMSVINASVCKFTSDFEFNEEWSKDLYYLNKKCDWLD